MYVTYKTSKNKKEFADKQPKFKCFSSFGKIGMGFYEK